MTAIRSGWLVGSATTTFPIEVGTPMGGYVARSGPSTGTLDSLTISALALSANERELVIVSADVVAVDAALSQRIAGAAGIPRSSLLLAASHTHSGPAGLSHKLHPSSSERPDHPLRARFVADCAGAIAQARRRKVPAILSMGSSTTIGLASNRNNPDGPYDPTVTALHVDRDDGSPAAVIIHWACHPTILGAENQLISADFPGALRTHLGRRLDPGPSNVLYLNGAAGDVSTRFTRIDQTPGEVDRLGSALSRAAAQAIDSALPLKALIDHASVSVQLSGWDRDQIAAMISALSDPPDGGSQLTEAESRLSVTRAQGLAMLQSLSQSACRPRRRSVHLDAWKLGDWMILGVPGELFAGLGQTLVASGLLPSIVVAYAGGYVGYLADTAAYEAGTYEALASPFAPGSGERVVDTAVSLLVELGSRTEGGTGAIARTQPPVS